MVTARRLLLLATLAAPLQAQSTPHDLLQKALSGDAETRLAQSHFTYFDLDRTQNRDEKGKLFFDKTILYEDTYIADLPYKRIVEVNGKPLTGSDLEREQARYDQAVAERKGLDAKARASLVHIKLVDAGLRLPDLLTPTYTLTDLGQEFIEGQAMHVIDATPMGLATRHYQLWVSDVNPTILKLTLTVTQDEPEMLHGSTVQKEFQIVDGIAVPKHSLAHFFYPTRGRTITVDAEHTYTRYRRFSSTTRILSTGDTPQ